MEEIEENSIALDKIENSDTKDINKIEENSIEDYKIDLETSHAETTTQPSNGSVPTLSKRQLKKIKKRKEIQEIRRKKRLKQREKVKEAKAKGEFRLTGPSRKELKRNKLDNLNCKYTIAVDCSFNDLMTDHDLMKCVRQMLRVYTINRRSKCPIKLHYTSVVKGNRMYNILEKNDGYQNWDVKFSPDLYTDVFDKSKIIYLSSDSPNTIEKLEEDKVYIIGGLVDHNHHKGISIDRAIEAGVQHAKLPLNENIILKTRHVLSIYHVFEILLKISEGKTWEEAMVETLPARKGAIAKSKLESDSDNDD